MTGMTRGMLNILSFSVCMGVTNQLHALEVKIENRSEASWTYKVVANSNLRISMVDGAKAMAASREDNPVAVSTQYLTWEIKGGAKLDFRVRDPYMGRFSVSISIGDSHHNYRKIMLAFDGKKTSFIEPSPGKNPTYGKNQDHPMADRKWVGENLDDGVTEFPNDPLGIIIKAAEYPLAKPGKH